LNLGDRIGSLEPGKIADFVIHDCDDYRELAYFFGIERAWRVFRRGHQINHSGTSRK
jgi:imidazolonepropionase